jgi:hypothetical protein
MCTYLSRDECARNSSVPSVGQWRSLHLPC